MLTLFLFFLTVGLATGIIVASFVVLGPIGGAISAVLVLTLSITGLTSDK